jgi:class 3 adenylate cyclase
VLITASTHECLGETIEADARGAQALKGKDEPVELFAPVVGTVDPLAAGPVSGSPR